MFINGLKFRYVNYACYEIVLPNGKVIVVDPCIDMGPMPGEKEHLAPDFKKEEFTGADYIILSHTHADHTLEVGYLAKKYNSKIIVGAMSALSLAEAYDLNTDQVYPCFPNEKFIMEDFTIEVFRGKHTFNRRGPTLGERLKNPASFEKTPAEQLASIYGSMEYCDFMITTKENVRIFICGGQPQRFYFTNADEIVKEKAPNIVIRQSSSKYTPEEFGRHMDQFGPQLVLPLHQDGLARSPIGDLTPQGWFDKANAELERIGSQTRILNPVPARWYTVGMSITEE